MIFLDTNIFLRYVVEPSSGNPHGDRQYAIATAIFLAVEQGRQEITTSEVVLHEVCFILSSRHHYHLPADEIADRLMPIIQMPGFTLPQGEKALYLRAFEVYVSNPKLEFSDSLIAARAERLGIPLATFDEALARLPIVTRWQPPTGS